MSRSEKIAIVGIGGIFPGSSTLDGFWNNVVNGVDCSKEIPEGRWPVDPKKFYDPEVGTLDKVPNLRGYFMDKLSNDFYGLDIDIDAVDQLDELFKLVLLATVNFNSTICVCFINCVTQPRNTFCCRFNK